MSFLTIEESSLLGTLNHEISRCSYLRAVEMTTRFTLIVGILNRHTFIFRRNSKDMKRLSVQRVQRSGCDSVVSCRI
jgi:hypothetical protein